MILSNDVSTAGDVIRFLRENYPRNPEGTFVRTKANGFNIVDGRAKSFVPQVIDDYQLAKGLSRMKGRLGASYTVDLDHKQGSLFVPFPVDVARRQSRLGSGYASIPFSNEDREAFRENAWLVWELNPSHVLAELCADINGLINFVDSIQNFPKKEAVKRKLQSARNEL